MEAETQHQLETLAGLVKTSGLTPAGFQSLVLKLGPQESRLFAHLLDGPSDTVKIRNACSIGNISAVRASLNAKLEASGDPRMVVCSLIPHQNRFGERGHIGEWRILDARALNDEGGP